MLRKNCLFTDLNLDGVFLYISHQEDLPSVVPPLFTLNKSES